MEQAVGYKLDYNPEAPSGEAWWTLTEIGEGKPTYDLLSSPTYHEPNGAAAGGVTVTFAKEEGPQTLDLSFYLNVFTDTAKNTKELANLEKDTNASNESLVGPQSPTGMPPPDSTMGNTVSTAPGTAETPHSSETNSTASMPSSTPGQSSKNGAYRLSASSTISWLSCESESSTTEYSCTPEHPPDTTPGIAAAGALGALFLLTLGALIFLLFRRRRRPTAIPITYEPKTASNTSTTRIAALEEENASLTAALAASQHRHPSAPLDDRTVGSRYDGISQEIKDWAVNHFRSGQGEIPGEYAALLQTPKTRVLVIRALATRMIWEAVESGEAFLDGAVKTVEREVSRNVGESDFHRWRAQTYTSLHALPPSDNAIAIIASRIDTHLCPLSDLPSDPARLHTLNGIIRTAAILSKDLSTQTAKWSIDVNAAEYATFDARAMDDVLQEAETWVDPRNGERVSQLEGRRVRLAVVPGLVKWGGENSGYEEMTVVVRAKVLV